MKNTNPLGLSEDHLLMEKLTKLGDLLQKLSLVNILTIVYLQHF